MELGKDFRSLFGENEKKVICFRDFLTFKRVRAELVEPDKQIICNRQWTTLFCPIKTLQGAQDPLFANLYVDYTAFEDKLANLKCTTPSNDGDFYNTAMRRL